MEEKKPVTERRREPITNTAKILAVEEALVYLFFPWVWFFAYFLSGVVYTSSRAVSVRLPKNVRVSNFKLFTEVC